MVSLRVRFAPDQDALRQLREEAQQEAKRVIRGNFGDLRSFVSTAINAGVEATRNEFIPNSREIAELGVGRNGQPDTSRTEGAYKQLRTDSQTPFTRFTIRRQRPTARDNLIGAVTITIDEQSFLNSKLAKVPTPDSENIDEIPWLRWLIFGAPTNTNFRFINRRPIPKGSRTGGGIMVEGGIWAFPPARAGAFTLLSQNVERRVIGFIQEEVGDIL